MRRARAPMASGDERCAPVSIHGVDLEPSRRGVRVRGEAIDVTRQEFNLLYVLASSPGIVFTRDRLLSRVWQEQSFVTGRSVDTLVKRLRKKIEIDPADPQLILTVWGDGYKFADVVCLSWYQSLYWRIGIGFVLFLAAMLAAPGRARSCILISRMEVAPGPRASGSDAPRARAISAKRSARNPQLDIQQFLAAGVRRTAAARRRS